MVMILDSLPDFDISGLCLVKTLSTALTASEHPRRLRRAPKGGRPRYTARAAEDNRSTLIADIPFPVPGVLKRSSISSSGDGPTSPGGVAVDRAGGGSGRWLSLSWWWACESRRGRSRRGSGRGSGLSAVRGRLRGLSWGNRPHFGADQPLST